jgi:predicted RNA-binding Zn-ribbon protein involved in translation (DUF1610 family)
VPAQTVAPELAAEWHPTLNGNDPAAIEQVSAPSPSWHRSMLTEIHLCHACSCQEILRTETARQVGRLMLPGPVATAVAAAAAAARGRATKMSETQPYTRSAGYADLSQGPASVSVYSSVKVWWQCPEGTDHIFQATPKQRLHGYNCPSCANRQVSVTNSLAGVFPGEHSGRAPGLTH